MSRSVKYRQSLKQKNPEQYQHYLLQQKIRAKERRDQLNEEITKKSPNPEAVKKKEHERILAKERQKKYRDRKKKKEEQGEKLVVKITPKKLSTRKQIEEQRKYWRSAKQREKAKWTSQKHNWVKKKDRDRKRSKKLQKHEGSDKNQNDQSLKTPFSSQKAEWNITSKVRASIPTTPEKYARVVTNLVRHRMTPRKRGAINKIEEKQDKQKHTTIPHKLKKTLKSTPSGHKALREVALKMLKRASKIRIAKETGLNIKTVRLLEKNGTRRKRRQNRIDPKKILNFYCREDVSRILPQKRFAIKSGPGYVMQISVKAAHTLFCSENNTKICFSKFASLRPRNVRLLGNSHRDFCLCVYCVNVRYKLLTLSRISTDERLKITNESNLSQILLCPKSDGRRFHAPECVSGTCSLCGDLEKTIRKVYSYALKQNKLVWNHWSRTEVCGKKRRTLETKTGSGEELIEEFVKDVVSPVQGVTFVKHLFNANWQYIQYTKAKENLPANSVLMIMDFAKNRTVSYQDEIKSAFFGAQQITMHPIVTYYNLNNQIVRDALIFLSNDITHDYHAVKHYTNMADNYLVNKLGMRPSLKIIFSDGCASQYKSKGPFADLSLAIDETSRNYFGSEHGKAEGDGEVGVINRSVDRAISGRKLIINHAKDMFDWCCENLSSEEPLSQRHFFFVNQGEIDRDRPFTQVKPVPDTRKIHQIKAVVNKPFCMSVRDLSCFCKSCLYGENVPCANASYVAAFKTILLRRTAEPVEVVPPEDMISADVLGELEDLGDVLVELEDKGTGKKCADVLEELEDLGDVLDLVELEDEGTGKKLPVLRMMGA